jgi:mannan endo-1,4-beta-mannosidase
MRSLTLTSLFAGVIISSLIACYAAPPKPIHLESAEAQLLGVKLLTALPGYTGSGYAGNFANAGDQVIFTVPNAGAGLYTVQIRYSSPLGDKGYNLGVNDAKFSGIFPKTGTVFATQPGGKVELTEGRNVLTIDRGWGYYYINSIDLIPAPPPGPLPKPPVTLSDPKAAPATRALMQYLVSHYGTKTLSGQYERDNEYVQEVTGKTPAIYGGDLIDYSPSRVAHGAHSNAVAEIVSRAKAGQIVTLSWHWNAPTGLIDTMGTDAQGKTVDRRWYRGFYTEATTFDVQKALADPKSPEYALLLRDIDAIAVPLQQLQDANIPILWRPLHEAEGGWFWWGAKGPEPFKQLWRLMYDRLTNFHHLHNLIWVDCSGTNAAWYPGDSYVDVVGVDAYPSDITDPLSTTWETLEKAYGGKKLLALTEFGGVPDVPKMRRYGVRWSYFVSWIGDVGPHKNSKDALTQIYRSPAVITLADKPGH